MLHAQILLLQLKINFVEILPLQILTLLLQLLPQKLKHQQLTILAKPLLLLIALMAQHLLLQQWQELYLLEMQTISVQHCQLQIVEVAPTQTMPMPKDFNHGLLIKMLHAKHLQQLNVQMEQLVQQRKWYNFFLEQMQQVLLVWIQQLLIVMMGPLESQLI